MHPKSVLSSVQFGLCYGGIFVSLVWLGGCQPKNRAVVDRLPPPTVHHLSRQPQPRRFTQPSRAAETRNPWSPADGVSTRWRAIVIHHSESATGSQRDIDQWHKAKGWDGCGYHFVIGNGTGSRDGEVEASFRWKGQLTGAHCRLKRDEELRLHLPENYYNEHSIGICLVGEFDRSRPSEHQLQSLARLLRYLLDETGIPLEQVHGHGDLKSTACPGRYFSMSDLKKRVRTLRSSVQR